MFISFRFIPTTIALGVFAIGTLSALDSDVRVVPQFLIGTSGFEPGVAFEFRAPMERGFVARPEVFFNDDGGIGAGGSLLWNVSTNTISSADSAIEVGPRVVFHNTDEDGLEIGAMAIYSMRLPVSGSDRHRLEIIGALGLLDDRKEDKFILGGSVGAGYSYRF